MLAQAAAYDVFNGDADGICALHQLRLAQPKDALLVTGVKREIELLRRIPCAAGIDVTVLDVSLDVNAASLKHILDAGGRVSYFDHHSAQAAFEHPRLQLFWSEAPDVCTSILVDRHLQGRFRPWAIAAAFGDNLPAVGQAMAQDLGLPAGRIDALEKLGLMLNYNAYGASIEDLHIAPDTLYRALHQFVDPGDFIAAAPEYRLLTEGYGNDIVRMEHLTPEWQSACGAIYMLPCMSWAHRISGIFANKLTAPADGRSYAVLTANTDGTYLVSVRSGAPAAKAANRFCQDFPGGDGRKAAAGINRLPAGELDKFIKCFSEYFH